MRSSLTPCESSTSIALMHEPPVARCQLRTWGAARTAHQAWGRAAGHSGWQCHPGAWRTVWSDGTRTLLTKSLGLKVSSSWSSASWSTSPGLYPNRTHALDQDLQPDQLWLYVKSAPHAPCLCALIVSCAFMSKGRKQLTGTTAVPQSRLHGLYLLVKVLLTAQFDPPRQLSISSRTTRSPRQRHPETYSPRMIDTPHILPSNVTPS